MNIRFLSKKQLLQLCLTVQFGIIKAKPKRDELLCMRMHEIAYTIIRYGFLRIFILLRREGFKDDHKRVYRLTKRKD